MTAGGLTMNFIVKLTTVLDSEPDCPSLRASSAAEQYLRSSVLQRLASAAGVPTLNVSIASIDCIAANALSAAARTAVITRTAVPDAASAKALVSKVTSDPAAVFSFGNDTADGVAEAVSFRVASVASEVIQRPALNLFNFCPPSTKLVQARNGVLACTCHVLLVFPCRYVSPECVFSRTAFVGTPSRLQGSPAPSLHVCSLFTAYHVHRTVILAW